MHIYMDYAAATPLSPVAIDAMRAIEGAYANPGSLHTHGQAAKKVHEDARARIARVLAVQTHDLIVAGSATEVNNLAILGMLRHVCSSRISTNNTHHTKPHFITTVIEHSSVLHVFNSPEMQAYADVTFLPVDAHGQVRADALKDALRPETVFVSIGWANGEVGTIQPLRALVHTVREYERIHGVRIYVHSDAGQIGFAHSMQPQGVDLDIMTLGSGKMYGPRGVAVLYKKYTTPLWPLMYGGAQESGLRPGTEDVVPLVGFAAALEELEKNRREEYVRLRALTLLFRDMVRKAIPRSVVNGEAKDQLPHVTNISVPGIDSEYVMLALDHRGVSISTKSVCIEATGEPVSHVVEAMARAAAPENLSSKNQNQVWCASTTLRFSFGRDTKEEDVRYAVSALAEILKTHGTHNI